MTEWAQNPNHKAFVLPRADVLREVARLGIYERLSPEPNTGCWLWTGAASAGYGKAYIRIGGAKYICCVHRLVWICERGDIAPELTVDHLCYQRICANPAHLELVAWSENLARRRAA